MTTADRLTFFDYGQRVSPPEPSVRTGSGEPLPMDLFHKAVADLERDRVPPMPDGTYHVHFTSLWRVLALLVPWPPRTRSWVKMQRVIEAKIKHDAPTPPQQWPSSSLAADKEPVDIAFIATEDERDKARAFLASRWKAMKKTRIARRRRRQVSRRGWA